MHIHNVFTDRFIAPDKAIGPVCVCLCLCVYVCVCLCLCARTMTFGHLT